MTVDLAISEVSWNTYALVVKANAKICIQFLKAFAQLFKKDRPKSINFWLEKTVDYENFLKQHFTFISEAGGVVRKDKQILMMKRLNKWDLPLGKLALGDNTGMVAMR